MKNIQLIIISGLSGAGKTSAINSFEDMGYFTIDNVPCSMGSVLLKAIKNGDMDKKKLCMGIDARSFENVDEFSSLLDEAEATGINYRLIFLESKVEVILNRYNLTRRKHPIEAKTILDSIIKERNLMSDIRKRASLILDTSSLKPKDIGLKLKKLLFDRKDEEITVHFQSFGFKYGTPIDLDLMFDVRFLKNPYYIEELRDKTGNDKEVAEYVMEFEESKEFFKRLVDMLEFLIPKFITEGKSHLSVGVGCSGGRHRSVTYINLLKEYFSGRSDIRVVTSHREEERGHWL
ncbi:RNase adapter RapZ [Ilyobacter sp.]|jgi:UPF0042 nucleotide-binding protein|uniref:RNase adapter RapZ n=1 Tax=Ilyobacter sp. TaxID=3100343 RepID=UPI00356918B3